MFRCLVGLVVAGWLVPCTTAAHAFGQRYNLPIPLGLYLSGAAATVVVSFVVVALFIRGQRTAPTRMVVSVCLRGGLEGAFRSFLVPLGRVISVSLFMLVLITGFFGSQEPLENLTSTLVWVIWWVGFAYLSALVGNIWRLFNPWAACFQWFEAVAHRPATHTHFSAGASLPDELDVWPATLLFFIFAWLELIWPDSQYPRATAVAIVLYTCVTWSGMALFGRECWLRRGEAFSIVFGLFARFAPLRAHHDGDRETLDVRPYAVGLLSREPVSPSLMVFVLLLLSTLTFDGFKDTPFWATSVETVLPLLLPIVGDRAYTLFNTLTFAAFPILFVAVYLAVIRLVVWAGGRKFAVELVARRFVLTIVPIAIAYHLAHYFSYLLVIGQYIIPLASDPFGFGWNLFGTAGYQVDISIAGVRTVWWFAVIAIVLGHVISVSLAHMTAIDVYGDSGAARRSQYPMLILMVGYTMLSLWLFAQPIV